MVSQARQLNFSRTVWITFHWRGPLARDDLQGLSDVLAQLGQFAAARRARARAGQHHAVARQIRGQWRAHWPLAGEALDHGVGQPGLGRSGFGGALILGGGGFHILQLQFQLVEQLAPPLGGGAKAVAPELGDLQLEVGDQRLGSHRPCLGGQARGLRLGQRGSQPFDGFGGRGRRHDHEHYRTTKRPGMLLKSQGQHKKSAECA